MTKASEKILNYARQREWRNLDRIHQSDAEVVAELHRILQRTLDNCKSQAEAWYTRYAAANGITPAEAKKRASTADIEALARKAQDYVRRRKDTAYAFSEQANKEMAEYNFAMKMSREELLMRYIDLELSAGTDEQNTLLGDHLSRLTEDELKRQAGLLGMRLPDHKELTDLARTIAQSSFHGETFSDRLWQNQKSLRTLLGDGIARSILLGKNPTTWMRSLETHLRDAGNNAKYNAKRLAITESGRVQIEAQKKSYERSGYSQYVVICEPTACKICMQHDGEVYETRELMQGKNAPMFHPFCKCSTSAYMDRKEVDDALAALEKAEGKTGTQWPTQLNDQIMQKLPDLSSIKTNGDIKGFAEQLIDNLGIDRSNISVSVTGTLDWGHCALGQGTTQTTIHYTDYVLNANDTRPFTHRVKTAFHEAFHLLAQDREWDGLTSAGKLKDAWRSIEETFTESAAHYLLERYGVSTKIAPSYPKELATNLPRLKRLSKYAGCNTIQDFGKIAFTDRENGANSKWMDLSKKMKKVQLPADYYQQYHPYILGHESDLLDMLLDNMPGFSKYRNNMLTDLQNAMNKDRLLLTSNEETVYYGIIACAMQKEGVK